LTLALAIRPERADRQTRGIIWMDSNERSTADTTTRTLRKIDRRRARGEAEEVLYVGSYDCTCDDRNHNCKI
jgi:hypothetical protein